MRVRRARILELTKENLTPLSQGLDASLCSVSPLIVTAEAVGAEKYVHAHLHLLPRVFSAQ